MLIQALKDILPDPHVVTKELQEEDEIVKLAWEYWNMTPNALRNNLGAANKYIRLFQAIAARADEGSAKIEAVAETILTTLRGEVASLRKLFRNHEERIVEVEVLRQEIGDLRRMHKIEHDRAEGNLPYMELKMQTLERKVEELEKEHFSHLIDEHNVGIKVKPQPKGGALYRPVQGGVARCKDEKGVEHPLIPGVSVVQGPDDDMGIFHHAERLDSAFCQIWAYWEGGLAEMPRWHSENDIIWLRNLSFPPFACADEGSNKSQDVGGDK